MSGGVDSSVSAYLLKKQGHNVIGLFMKNWEEPGICQAAVDAEDVAAVCHQIDIPFYSINLSKEYREKVFEEFLQDCRSGLTPNPDVLCNREIKFNVFFKKAMDLGADFLATGHYCRTIKNDAQSLLLKGSDPGKDQSYFLYAISQESLSKTLFPIGHLLKKEVRAIARQANLATSEKKDSTGICFIGERNFKEFVSQYLGYQKGPLLTLSGEKVGTHDGIAYYTIGQRKGLGLGGEGEAWFVVAKDPSRNAVIVERGTDHPALYFDELYATDLTWIGSPPSLPYSCSAKIRYRQKDVSCHLTQENGLMHVRFDSTQRAVTPGQSVVFYDGDITLGGGRILKAGPSHYEQQDPLSISDEAGFIHD
jgi:tRNA-uridine 2-sulfurtransferase